MCGQCAGSLITVLTLGLFEGSQLCQGALMQAYKLLLSLCCLPLLSSLCCFFLPTASLSLTVLFRLGCPWLISSPIMCCKRNKIKLIQSFSIFHVLVECFVQLMCCSVNIINVILILQLVKVVQWILVCYQTVTSSAHTHGKPLARKKEALWCHIHLLASSHEILTVVNAIIVWPLHHRWKTLIIILLLLS